MMRLELEQLDGSGLVEVQMSQDRYREHELHAGERVFIRPQNPRVFVGEKDAALVARA
jgi:hypothetical protein